MITDRKDMPLDYGDFNIKIDVDNGKILDWPEKKISAKIYIRAKDTGFNIIMIRIIKLFIRDLDMFLIF